MSNLLLRREVLEEKKWNTSDIFKSNEEWEEALINIQSEASKLVELKGKLISDNSTLLKGIDLYEQLQQRLNHLMTYVRLHLSTDGTNLVNQNNSQKVASVIAKVNAETSFFKVELMQMTEEVLQRYLEENPKLQNYQKVLKDILEEKAYALSPELEASLAALGNVLDAPQAIYQRSKSADMKFDGIVDEDGNELPMSASLYDDGYESSPSKHIRHEAYNSYMNTLDKYKNTIAQVYATEITKQVSISRLRSYPSVTDMLLEKQQVTKDMYENQLHIIQEELAPHMRRFAKLKKKQLGLNSLHFADLKAPFDPDFNTRISFKEATNQILDAVQIMGPEYSSIIEKAINNRWIDYGYNIGKSNGAFCAYPYGVHPYIFITWTDTMRSGFMLAHELGHAAHFYLAGENQSFLNFRPSTYFIEAPSTLNELILGDYMLKTSQDNELRRWIITQLLGTYYHNFVTHLLEGELQHRVYRLAEEGVPITATLLGKQKREALVNFWGDTVEFDKERELTWMRQGHYYMGLYPYTYSAGLTVATAVMEQIKEEGKPAIDRWIDALKTGGTLKPVDLIKKAGVDIQDPKSIKRAVKRVGDLVDELEKTFY